MQLAQCNILSGYARMHNKRNDLTKENGCAHKTCAWVDGYDWNIRHARILTQGKLSKQSLFKGDFKLTLTKSERKKKVPTKKNSPEMHCSNPSNTTFLLQWQEGNSISIRPNISQFCFWILRNFVSSYSMADTDTDVPLSKVPHVIC